jgi:hypothetical protein
MGPVLIVNRHFEKSRVVERAVRSICQETVVVETCEDARVWLDCARSHCVIICPTDGDRSHVELVTYIGAVGYPLPVVILGEKDQQLRGLLRDIATERRMTVHTFPIPSNSACFACCLQTRGRRRQGFPPRTCGAASRLTRSLRGTAPSGMPRRAADGMADVAQPVFLRCVFLRFACTLPAIISITDST